jgi:hypothetical protein
MSTDVSFGPPSDPVARRPRRRWVWIIVASAFAAVVALIVVVAAAVPLSSGIVRQKVIETLSNRFDSEVELADVRIRVFPRFHADIVGLAIHHERRHDVPPLIAIDKLTVDAGLVSLARKHIEDLAVTGLAINIPPDRKPSTAHEGDVASPPSSQQGPDGKDFIVDRLTARNARLVIIPNKPEKSPKVWNIHELHMRSVAFDKRMPFEAALTNAVPPGEIKVRGSFGPWQPEKPGATPLEGTFTFADADLSVFKGISGMLAAHGEFGGSLGRIAVHGETDTPKFTVAVSGNPVPLHASYHTTVDGTNGDTLLDRIDASFLNTSLVAKGGVVETPGKKGRTVTLDVVMDKARIEDVLRLAVKAPKSPMTGAMKLRTRFVLPPGEQDVVEKLRLDGEFAIATARFTNLDIQKKVDELSRRSRGTTAETDQASAVSNFLGRFRLGSGTLTLQTLTFDTPGASVRLAGTYQLRPQMMNFKGMLLMDATISQTQKGWKRFALKVIDPIFAKKGGSGGTALPIKIEGKRSDPRFGLDTGRLLKRGS